MDTAQWPQEIIGLGKPYSSMEEMMLSSSTTTRLPAAAAPQLVERRTRPHKEQALNCPRCNSSNTKFCYYNNYSLTQPRYFCKTCRRYWTEGGSLRNVPVGGGSRKNKRSNSNSSSIPSTSSNPSVTTTATTTSTITTSLPSSLKKMPDLTPPPISITTHNPKFHEGQDLNLAFPHHHLPQEFCNSSNTTTSTGALSAMELLSGGISTRGLSPFIPLPMRETSAAAFFTPPPGGFGLPGFRPSIPLQFSINGVGGNSTVGYAATMQEEGGGRVLFPFEDLTQVSTTAAEFEQNRGQGTDSSLFWNGVMGGGASW